MLAGVAQSWNHMASCRDRGVTGMLLAAGVLDGGVLRSVPIFGVFFETKPKIDLDVELWMGYSMSILGVLRDKGS